MALNFYTIYPSNTDTPDADYPVGKAVNESFAGAKDWFPLEKTWLNELLGFWGALLDAASMTPDGVPENVTASQYVDAIHALPISISKLTNGYASVDDANIQFGTAAGGYVKMNAVSGPDYGNFESRGTNTETYAQRLTIQDGGIRFDVNTGTSHYMHSVLKTISVSDVSFISGSPNYILVGGVTLTGINFGNVWKTELVMKNTTNVLTLPLVGDWANSAGTLALAEGYCVTRPGVSYVVGDYTTFYLQIWMDPANIT